MNLNDYQLSALKTNAELGSHVLNVLHMLLGMMTEIGELVDTYKKNLAYAKPIDMVNVEEEIGDIMWYIANFCTIEGLDLAKILDQNIAKLQTRYPDSFTEDSAIRRNLELERKVLESNSVTFTGGMIEINTR